MGVHENSEEVVDRAYHCIFLVVGDVHCTYPRVSTRSVYLYIVLIQKYGDQFDYHDLANESVTVVHHNRLSTNSTNGPNTCR